jgi:hypothetical protein
MTQNKVGMEFEFLVKIGKNLVIPSDFGFDTDEYIILGEARVSPGMYVAECVGNFHNEWYKTLSQARSNKVRIDISKGWDIISPSMQARVLRQMGNKEINQSLNLYGTDILELDDSVIENDKVIGKKISTGLHLHFSSLNVTTVTRTEYKQRNVGVDEYFVSGAHLEHYSVSRITMPVIEHFVRRLDNELLPQFAIDTELKFRSPGFYELKDHGFEYRSLPFNKKVLNNLDKILEFAFSLFGDL